MMGSIISRAETTASILFRVVLEQVLGNELDGLFRLLLGKLFERLKEQGHELLIEVSLDRQLLNFNLLYNMNN